jgi:hypothetical protein
VNEPGEFEIHVERGNPAPDEQAAILEALEELFGEEQRRVSSAAPGMSAWTLSGRLAARRDGMLDARGLLGWRAWPASARIPWAGRRHEGRVGRSDSR